MTPPEVEERSVEVPGGVLHARLRGPEEGVRLLMLHGGPGMSDRYLDGLVDEFADTYRVATFAQRGVAPSTAGAPFDLPTQAADVVAVLDALGWADPVVLGHSWGGHLLLHVLASHAGVLRAAVALDPLGGIGDGGAEAFQSAILARLHPDSAARLEDPDLSADDAWELLWPAYFPQDAVPPFLPIAQFPETNAAGWESFTAAIAGLAPRLAGVPVPTLFVTPEGSPVPDAAAADTAAVIGASASIVRIEGGHFPWLVVPGAVRTAVDRFLAG